MFMGVGVFLFLEYLRSGVGGPGGMKQEGEKRCRQMKGALVQQCLLAKKGAWAAGACKAYGLMALKQARICAFEHDGCCDAMRARPPPSGAYLPALHSQFLLHLCPHLRAFATHLSISLGSGLEACACIIKPINLNCITKC